ncbi:MAG: hypothetical protein IANPNBLG_04231 [Bryobacteraceae bacterium]|nr:hypothetical protein [Bryobacteraceae bacterium]
MTQSQLDLINRLEFQLSLLKLSTIPGPNGSGISEHLAQQARQLEEMVDRLTVPGCG